MQRFQINFFFHRLCKTIASRNGFTILELLVVISIIMVIAMVSIAGLSSYGDAQKLETATLGMKNMLQYTKSQVISQVNTCPAAQTLLGYKFLACCQGGSCPVCLSTKSYEVDSVCSGSSKFINGDMLPSGVTIDTLNSTSFSYMFNTVSNTVTGAGTLILKQGSNQDSISISQSGVIQ